MKLLSTNYFIIPMLLMPVLVSAQTLDFSSDNDILAQRGKGQVTQADFTARADKIPEKARRAALRDTGRLQNVLNTLLMRAQLAADAREAGYDQEQIIKKRMSLAADAELGEAWLAHYVDIQPAADYERLAQEYYQLNKQEMFSTARIDVSHILISTKERTPEEATELADSISQTLAADSSQFDELVMTYSDDPSKSTNKGMFFRVGKGDMVDSFDEKAFSMQPGEISAPVETNYGFHIIRLDQYYEPEMMSFDAVKDRLIDSEKRRHEERNKQQYLSSLTSLDVEMSKEALEEMARRQIEDTGTELPDGNAE